MTATIRGAAGVDTGRPRVEVVDLHKRYPRRPVDVVDGLSFEVAPGEVFGLLGPNGAGKTTTMGILTTRVLPTAGVVRLAGLDVVAEPARARAALAVVPQRNNLDRSLTIRQNLVFHASYHLVKRRRSEARADELLEQFGLADVAGESADDLSGGQAQRVMIARALMHAPQVLFLDEPSTGLDPASRLFVWERVAELRGTGTTVVVTTHDMHEAATVCDRVGVVDHGKLLVTGRPADLVADLSGERTLDTRVRLADGVTASELTERLQSVEHVARVEVVGSGAAGGGGGGGNSNWAAWAGNPGAAAWAAKAKAKAGAGTGGDGNSAGDSDTVRLRLSVQGDAATLVAPVAAAVSELGAALQSVTIGEPSLEDVFIHLTGRALR
jgi:ABC-2 type transport system ATP-binding protein